MSTLLFGGESSIACGRNVQVAKRLGGESSSWRIVLAAKCTWLGAKRPGGRNVKVAIGETSINPEVNYINRNHQSQTYSTLSKRSWMHKISTTDCYQWQHQQHVTSVTVANMAADFVILVK